MTGEIANDFLPWIFLPAVEGGQLSVRLGTEANGEEVSKLEGDFKNLEFGLEHMYDFCSSAIDVQVLSEMELKLAIVAALGHISSPLRT